MAESLGDGSTFTVAFHTNSHQLGAELGEPRAQTAEARAAKVYGNKKADKSSTSLSLF